MVVPWIGMPELTMVLVICGQVLSVVLSVLALKKDGRVLVVVLLGARDLR